MGEEGERKRPESSTEATKRLEGKEGESESVFGEYISFFAFSLCVLIWFLVFEDRET